MDIELEALLESASNKLLAELEAENEKLKAKIAALEIREQGYLSELREYAADVKRLLTNQLEVRP